MAKYLYSALEYRGLPPPQFDPTLQSASFSRSAGVPAHEWGKDLSPLNPEEMFSRLVHRFDTLALPLVLTAQTAPATPATSDTLDAPNRKIWNYHSIELESSVFPTELISLIGDIPAVVPQTLTYTPGTQTWKLSAFIYNEQNSKSAGIAQDRHAMVPEAVWLLCRCRCSNHRFRGDSICGSRIRTRRNAARSGAAAGQCVAQPANDGPNHE
jgi:hypothetical protein